MTKMKNTALNVIKTIFVLAVLSFMIVAGIFIWNLIVKEPAIDDPIVDGPTVQQTFEFTVNEFTLFEIEEFGFDFILADIHVKSNKPINISLSHFTTSENIQLNSVDQYLGRIESAGYTFGDYELVFSLYSSNTEMDGLLFIPIVNTEITALDVNINLYPSSILSFDLNNPTNIGTKSYLGVSETGLEPEQVSEITVDKVFAVSKSHFYTLDANGDRSDAFFVSNSKIVGVGLTVINKTDNPFRIQNAILVSSDSKSFALIDPTYQVDGYELIMNKYLSETTSGYVFYEVFDQNFDINTITEIRILLSSMDVEKLYPIKINE